MSLLRGWRTEPPQEGERGKKQPAELAGRKKEKQDTVSRKGKNKDGLGQVRAFAKFDR